ncbi:hypothetical protein ACFLWA_12760 [Chloroflexota bacterium]
MNLKLRRLVRTASSEQYALFDLDQTDANYDPLSIGKLDIHFSESGAYGTFLLWRVAVAGIAPEQVRALAQATIEEICEPVGVPAFYAIEFFTPDLEGYELHSNERPAQHSLAET